MQLLIVDLVDDRSLSVPLSWDPRLQQASDEERQDWQLLGDGYAIASPGRSGLPSRILSKANYNLRAAAVSGNQG